MRNIYRLAVGLAMLALAGCGTPDRPAASGDTAQATTDPAYPTLAIMAELTPTTELTMTAEFTPTTLPAPTAVPTAALTPTAVTPANVVGTPPDPLNTIWIASGSKQCEVPRSPVQTTFGKTLRYVDPAGVVYTDPRLFFDVVHL